MECNSHAVYNKQIFRSQEVSRAKNIENILPIALKIVIFIPEMTVFEFKLAQITDFLMKNWLFSLRLNFLACQKISRFALISTF